MVFEISQFHSGFETFYVGLHEATSVNEHRHETDES
jgi:hypothetical protein